MFCPQCKGLMISSGGQMKCRKCGYIRDISDTDQLKHTKKREEKTITIIEDESEMSTLPTCTQKCPECDNTTAYWWLRQLRSADESEVRFFRCTACGKVWREYD
ncbi:MAG: transcription factor S [Methanomicrobiales archaeon]